MKKEANYKHFVITRFNIRANYGCALKNPDHNPMKRILEEDYLKERFLIFEKYTLPSLKQQTNQNFTWLILFHKDTPDRFKKRIEELKKDFDFVDLYFGEEENFSFSEYCTAYKENMKYAITSRIDNDDMFSNQYIDEIQKYANHNLQECILSFSMGRKYDMISKKIYNCEQKDNHFLSMIGTKEKCILQYNHTKIFDSGEKVVLLDSKHPMWTEIIHDSNVTNRIKVEDQEVEKQEW